MAVYDSAKIRYVATLIRRIADDVRTDVQPNIRSAEAGCEDIRGKTAEAMEEQYLQLFRRACGLEEEMQLLARQINTYADMLEYADKQLAEKL